MTIYDFVDWFFTYGFPIYIIAFISLIIFGLSRSKNNSSPTGSKRARAFKETRPSNPYGSGSTMHEYQRFNRGNNYDK